MAPQELRTKRTKTGFSAPTVGAEVERDAQRVLRNPGKFANRPLGSTIYSIIFNKLDETT